jgi:hypothetical protein
MSGYWAIFVLWLLTVPLGLLMAWADTHGQIYFRLEVRSVTDLAWLVLDVLVLTWLLFPVWGYFVFRRRAERER